MKKVATQAGIFLALLFAYTLVRFPYGNYAESLLRKAETKIQNAGLPVAFGGAELGFPTLLTFREVELLPHPLVSLKFPRVKLRPHLLSLFLLSASGSADLVAYGSALKNVISYGFWSKQWEIDTKAERLLLQEHPQLQALGIQGNLSVSCEAEGRQQLAKIEDVENGSLSIVLDKGSYPGGDTIKGLITLPKVEDVSLEILARQRKSKVLLEKFALASSLGSAEGEGKITLQPATRIGEIAIKSASIDFDIKLTESGLNSFGGWLALNAGEPVETKARRWGVSIKLRGRFSPEIKVARKAV